MLKKLIAFCMVFCFILPTSTLLSSAEENIQPNYSTVDYNSDYAQYISKHNSAAVSSTNISIDINEILSNSSVTADFTIPNSALYNIGMLYKTLSNQVGTFNVKFLIDEAAPFEAFNNIKCPRIWEESSEILVDDFKNDIPKEQFLSNEYHLYYLTDPTGWSCEPYLVYLEAGEHTVTIYSDSEIELSKIQFLAPEHTSKYNAPANNKDYYIGDKIVIEGENAKKKTSYWITSKSDDTSAKINPSNPYNSKLNYIGGNWKTNDETITWVTPKLKAGWYNIGFSYRQEGVIGSSVYRWLKIDGKTPFEEAKSLAFEYDNGWQLKKAADKDNEPYLFYFSEGSHEISLTVTLGELEPVCDTLREVVDIISAIYMDITMVTGETVDINRDYDLFIQIPDMESRLIKSKELLVTALEKLEMVSNGAKGSHSSVIDNMIQVIDKMLENKYSAHRYKNTFFNNYCSLSSVMGDMRSMPLDLDQIILSSPTEELEYENNFFEQLLFSVKRFFISFVSDYSVMNSTENNENSIEIWVNWGRDQAQVLTTLTSKFSEERGIDVNIKITNATIVQAVLSGKGPNVILHAARTEPVNLAMRGVLCDLYQFNDCNEVLKQFQPGAETPYKYKDGLYALPDMQTFYMMYYRKDVFDELGITVPKTWDEFKRIVKILARNNLQTWVPYTQITDMNQVNSGVGSLSIFPTLMLQSGKSLYAEDGRNTTLSDSETIKVFENWTNFYTKYKLPYTINFYNRFKIGTCPLGIDSYLTYNTLTAAAPEIDGKWGMTAVPGTQQADGTINYSTAGGGTGCAILKSTKEKEKLSWEYLKWWVSSETQLAYSSNIEAVLGPTGRVATSNVETMLNFQWDEETKKEIAAAWANVKEINEYPGSYYVARAIDHSFWSVAKNNENPKDMLYKWGSEVDKEMNRKWQQYENR